MHARKISKAKAAHICTTIHTMSEKQRRQYAAREAMLIGYGGVSAIARITGLSIPTIKKGIKEIENGDLYMFPVFPSFRLKTISCYVIIALGEIRSYFAHMAG